MTKLIINNASKSYGDNQVLKDVSFEIHDNEKICILGASGSGKSTLLKIIAGLLESDTGEMKLDGKVIPLYNDSVPPEERPMNMVFQNYALWPHMTVYDNITFGLKIQKLSKREIESRVERFVQMLQISHLLGRMPAELSGGQQQRVGIARAMASLPSILLMDEPLSNLDVKLRNDLRSELSSILKDLNTSTLYVTHDVLEAFALADRILVLHKGEIVQLDTPEKVYEEPSTIDVANLMGYQKAFFGEVEDVKNGVATINVDGATIMAQTHETIEPNVNVDVLIQQDSLVINRTQEDQSGYNNLSCKVAQRIYEGSRWKYRLQVSERQYIESYSKDHFEEHTEVVVSFEVDKTKVFERK